MNIFDTSDERAGALLSTIGDKACEAMSMAQGRPLMIFMVMVDPQNGQFTATSNMEAEEVCELSKLLAQAHTEGAFEMVEAKEETKQ